MYINIENIENVGIVHTSTHAKLFFPAYYIYLYIYTYISKNATSVGLRAVSGTKDGVLMFVSMEVRGAWRVW